MRRTFRTAALPLTAGLILGIGSSGCRRSADPAALADGLAKVREKDYATAIVRLSEAVRGNPRDVTALANLGIAYWRAGAAQSATRPLLDAASLSDQHPRILELLGLVYTELGDWPAAADWLRRAQERSGQPTPRILTERAIVEARAGRASAGEALLQEALRLNGDYAPALYNLAVLNRDRQNPDAAAIYFGRFALVAQDASRVAAARRYIAQAEAQGRAHTPGTAARATPIRTVAPPTQAVSRAASPVVTQRVENAAEYLTRARASIRKNEFGEAAALLLRARQLDPKNPDIAWEYACVCRDGLQQTEKANAAFALFAQDFPGDPRAVEVRRKPSATATGRGHSIGASTKPPTAGPKPDAPPTPTQTDAQRNRRAAVEASAEGLRLHKTGDLGRAIALYRQALALDPKLDHVMYNLGLALDQNGDAAGAVQAFEGAIAAKPEMLDARYMLGVGLRKLGDLERAVVETRKLLIIDAGYAKGHLLLGMLYEQLRRPDLARAPYEELLRLDPKNPAVDRIRQWLRDNPAPAARHGSPPLPRSR